MAAEAGGDTRCGIGTRLRSARERKALTVLQAAEKLHVDARVLESLEAEDFAALGAPVYVRGHLRHYAELVGEPAAELQELYSSTTKTAQPDLTRIPKAQPKEDPAKLVAPALVLLVAFGLIGTVWWVLKLSGGKPPAAQVASGTNGVSPAPNDVQSASSASASAGAATAAVAAQPTAAIKAGAGSAAGANAAAGSAQTKQPPTGSGPTPARQAELTLKFSADSWTEVYDAAGQRLFYDIGAADSVRTLKGTPPLRIILGNAPGVAVEVNGRAATIESVVQPDGSAQFLINRSGRVTRVKPAVDGG